MAEGSSPVKVLETDRLILCEMSVEDADFILEIVNEPAFLQFIGDRGVRTIEEARRYIREGPIDSYKRHGFGLYLTKLKDEEAPIGICGLIKRESLDDVDIGFAFSSRFWGKGYAVEAASAVMSYGRSAFGLDRIVAIVSPENSSSKKVLEKLGMRIERMVKMPGDDEEIELYAGEVSESPRDRAR